MYWTAPIAGIQVPKCGISSWAENVSCWLIRDHSDDVFGLRLMGGMRTFEAPKPTNAQIAACIGRRTGPVTPEPAFPHSQDPDRTFANARH